MFDLRPYNRKNMISSYNPFREMEEMERHFFDDPFGSNVAGKDVMIVDDMISSGESMLEVASKLKELGAARIFIFSAFGLFCEGLDSFDKAYQDGIFNKVFTTNLVYRTPELLQRDWYCEVDMSKYLSYIIDTLNHDMSVSKLLNPADRIDNLLRKKGYKK